MNNNWGPSPFQDLLELWVKLQAINMGHIDKPKFYFITSDQLEPKPKVYKFPVAEDLEVYIFHSDYKDELLTRAIENGWQPVDYQEFSKTSEWEEKFRGKMFDRVILSGIDRSMIRWLKNE